MSQIQSFGSSSGSPGSGNVIGPGASTIGDLVIWSDAAGTTIDDSGIQFTDVVLKSGSTMTGDLILNGNPLVPNQAANKAYVDAIAAGANFEQFVIAASTVPLNAIYANGAGGVGATLTNNGALAAFTLDTVPLVLNDRVLIKDQASSLENGIYQVTVVGSGILAWELTRTTDYDQPAEILQGTVVPVQSGAVNANTSWIETAMVTNVGVDPIVFTQFTYNAATFLQVANNLSDLNNLVTARQNLGVEIGVDVEAWSAQLDSLAAVAANGMLARTAANTITPRTITGGGIINVANGDGVAGNPTITATAGGYPITPYVVGPVGQAGYATIQSAVNAANAAGGGAVFIQPGVYAENLTLFGNIQLVGAVGNSDTNTVGNTVVIQGVHTPPAAGYVSFTNLFLESATDILNSVVAGTALLVFENCLMKIANGYIFNLPNWTGIMALFHIEDDAGGAINGVVNNTGGGLCFFQNSFVGTGSANVMTTSGPIVFQNVQLNCPWNGGNGTVSLTHVCTFNNGVTMSGNATGDIDLCSLYGPAGPAFTMSSSQPFNIVNSIIETSNNPAIDGAGAGTLNLMNVTYTDNSVVAGTVNAVNAGLTDLADIRANYTDHALLVGRGLRGTLTTIGAGASAGQVLQSNGAAADPTFSTATYPATTTINQILYSSANNVVNEITAGIDGVLVTSHTGVPSILPNSGTPGWVLTANANLPPSWQAAPASGITGTVGQFKVAVGDVGNTLTSVGPGLAGQVLQSGGAAANPSYSTPTYPATSGGAGVILRSDGTNNVYTTATYPATTTINQVLYSSANNVINEITAGNDGVLVSSHTGVPSWLANGTAGQVLTANTNLPPSWQPAASGGIVWSVVTVDAPFTVNTGTIANKAGLLTRTLPASAAIGDIIEITGINTDLGWKIAQNANQQIFFGEQSTTLGAGGSLASTLKRDSLKMVCVVAGASTVWNVISSVGDITVV